MAETKSTGNRAQKSRKGASTKSKASASTKSKASAPAKGKASTSAKSKASGGFTAEERAAMKERSRELKAASSGKADGESDVLAKIAEMQEPDRAKAQRIHEIVKEVAPSLTSKTWYGMPAYARDGKVVCFFQSAQKFKSRYAMLGFSDNANLDDGAMWPVYFALSELTGEVEKKITKLVKKAVA
jgi:uncharacterized protein YdhG (YjbR/CyaY superfamily)